MYMLSDAIPMLSLFSIPGDSMAQEVISLIKELSPLSSIKSINLQLESRGGASISYGA